MTFGGPLGETGVHGRGVGGRKRHLWEVLGEWSTIIVGEPFLFPFPWPFAQEGLRLWLTSLE